MRRGSKGFSAASFLSKKGQFNLKKQDFAQEDLRKNRKARIIDARKA